MSAAITVRNLVKEYTTKQNSNRPFPLNMLFQNVVTHRAVDNISFTINEGEFVGYIGPNGAGKSTSIKVLTGILAPTSGDVSVLGIRPDRDRITNARNIGVVFGQRTQLWWDLPVRDSFEILKAIYDVPEAAYSRNIEFFLTYLDLERFWEKPVRLLSLGERMRAEICAALLHNPPVLFLDEPTIGLDVVAKEKIRRFLAELNGEQRVTILLTTHDMGDIERLCSRLILVNGGKILYDGSVDDLRDEAQSTVLVFEVADFDRPLELRCGRVVREEGAHKWVAYDSALLTMGDVVKEVARSHRIVNVHAEREAIEDIIRHMYEHPDTQTGRRTVANGR